MDICKDGRIYIGKEKEECFNYGKLMCKGPEGEVSRWQCIWVDLRPELSLDYLGTGRRETTEHLKNPVWYQE